MEKSSASVLPTFDLGIGLGQENLTIPRLASVTAKIKINCLGLGRQSAPRSDTGFEFEIYPVLFAIL